MPNEVTPTTTDATTVFISQRYRKRAHQGSNSATCNINESNSNTWSRYHLTTPSSFRCRFWLRSMAEPRMLTETYRFNLAATASQPSRGRRRGERQQGWRTGCIELGLSSEEGRSTAKKRENVAAKGGIVDLVDEDREKSGGFFIWDQLQPGVDLDNECRGHGGEQTGLSPGIACVCCISLQTHQYQDGLRHAS